MSPRGQAIVGIGFLPFLGPWNGYAYPYYGDPYARDPLLNRVDTLPPTERLPTADTPPPFDRRVAVPGPTGTDSLVVEEVPLVEKGAAPILRVTWRDRGRPAEEVALFEPTPETAFAGLTVVWPSG